jgi:enoyl-CoA hydratase/carnithine racemase
MSHLALRIENQIATLTLRNPPGNRIDTTMVDELEVALDAIQASGARVTVVCAEGKDFCFGGDINPWPEMSNQALRGRFEHTMSVFNRFERLPMPVIAAVQGLCFGGGLELALRADLIFAGSSATFGHPEQTLGIVTLLGGVYRLAEKVGRALAFEWALTSERVPAATLERHGVVNRVVDDADLMAETNAFAAKLAQGPTRAHAAHKALLRNWAVGGVGAADEVMFDIAMPLFETEDVRNGLASAIDALRSGKPRPALTFNGH